MTKNPDLLPTSIALNVVRGALIGTVETVPGVSGGTVALVVGVYERLIGAASSIMTGVKEFAGGVVRKDSYRRAEGKRRFKSLPWGLLLAVLAGMFIALIAMSHIMSALVEAQPILTSATFFGMVLASLYVPYQMAGKWRGIDWLWAAVAAAVVYFIVSLPTAGDMSNPHALMIVAAAAVAVSALLLPGLSGSFLLLTFGLYETTLGAVKDVNLGYLALFALGALIGLATIVKGLEWLLEHKHHITLVVLTGVMVGALRALWPWTTADNNPLPIGEQGGAAIIMCIIGFALVTAVILAEHLFSGKKQTSETQH